MKNSPCCGCTDRTAECHAACERYKAWKAWRNEVNQWLKDQHPPDSQRLKKASADKIRRRARGQERKVRKYD